MKRRLVVSRANGHDVGTLWILRRARFAARCALIACSGDWEVRLVIDGEILKTQRCSRGEGAFAIAARWKGRMLEQGWEPIGPQPAVGA